MAWKSCCKKNIYDWPRKKSCSLTTTTSSILSILVAKFIELRFQVVWYSCTLQIWLPSWTIVPNMQNDWWEKKFKRRHNCENNYPFHEIGLFHEIGPIQYYSEGINKLNLGWLIGLSNHPRLYEAQLYTHVLNHFTVNFFLSVCIDTPILSFVEFLLYLTRSCPSPFFNGQTACPLHDPLNE